MRRLADRSDERGSQSGSVSRGIPESLLAPYTSSAGESDECPEQRPESATSDSGASVQGWVSSCEVTVVARDGPCQLTGTRT